MKTRTRAFVILLAVVALGSMIVPSAFAAGKVVDFSAIGLVYNDLNCDGAYSATASSMDAAMHGIQVRAYADNAPLGIFGPEDVFVSSYETDTEGYVVFHTTVAGEYLLVIDKPLGFLSTTPEAQSIGVEDADGPVLVMRTFGLTLRQNMPERKYFPLLGR